MKSKNKTDESAEFPAGFFQQFKDKESFHDFFNSFYKKGIETLLQAEMDAHLGYLKHAKDGYNSGNSRNGSFEKTVTTESLGDIVLNIPRDRLGEFSPKIIPKGETISSKIEDTILGLYSRGMSVSDIQLQVQELYGLEISGTTVSNITEKIMASVKEWQQRPLEPVYFTVWMDGIVMKVREDGKLVQKCVYIVIGLKPDGIKEVLGFWIESTESAAFWMTVLTDLKARGVKDILIACTDNLKGFTTAISAVFPETTTQLCIVHQIRNSCRFVVYKDRRLFCNDLKLVYTAPNSQVALEELEKFKVKWEKKYKYAIISWETNWDNLSNYFEYPLELRKIIYTTNTIENLNRGIRKYTKTKTQFTNQNAASKSVYLSIQNIELKWTQPIAKWGIILQQFAIIFENRCRLK